MLMTESERVCVMNQWCHHKGHSACCKNRCIKALEQENMQQSMKPVSWEYTTVEDVF